MLGILLVGAFVGMRFAGMNFLLVLLVAGVLNLLFVIRPAEPPIDICLVAFVASGFSVLGFFDGKLLQLAWLFLKTGLFSFGGAYASLAFLQQGAVENHHWLTSGQLLDGVAMSVATPGPFMLFATFVGYLAARHSGCDRCTVFVFLPSFVFVLAGCALRRAGSQQSSGSSVSLRRQRCRSRRDSGRIDRSCPRGYRRNSEPCHNSNRFRLHRGFQGRCGEACCRRNSVRNLYAAVKALLLTYRFINQDHYCRTNTSE